jgi:hypothetical protein
MDRPIRGRTHRARIVTAFAMAMAVPQFVPADAVAWGERTHEIINRRAVDFLPDAQRAAWSGLAVPLGGHASDADHRKSFDKDEGQRHFIDIDAHDDPPFAKVPRTFEGLKDKVGAEEALRWGIVPWAIDDAYRMFVISMERGDWGSAVAWGADLGHYVADSHQPLHCTMNYDGQSTGNRGVHVRFEITMMDRYYQEGALPADGEGDEPMPYGGAPAAYCLDWIPLAYDGLSSILDADTRAQSADSDFGDEYYRIMWEGTAPTARLQVHRAARDLAVLYAAAWEEAGSPVPPEVMPPAVALPRELLNGPVGEEVPLKRAAYVVAGIAVVGAFLLGGL